MRCKNFGVLAWNCLFTPLFGEYFPHMTSSIVQTPKGPSLGRNTSFEPFGVTISATVRPGGRIEKKNSRPITKKVTRVLYFPYLGGSPRWADSTLKLHGWWCPRRNHVCRVSNWNLHGLRFYSGSNFRFSYWFVHCPYNSAALMRCLWSPCVGHFRDDFTGQTTVVHKCHPSPTSIDTTISQLKHNYTRTPQQCCDVLLEG